tara:strand:+ start:3703 stop:3993 length:291 start_codon:yes stop_codon:yes gene_type:complete
MSDERRGLPSASGLEQIALCPGSFVAQQGIEDVAGEAAARGTRIHAYLEGQEIILNTEEQDCADNLAAKRDEMVERVFPDGKKLKVIKEVRLWLQK